MNPLQKFERKWQIESIAEHDKRQLQMFDLLKSMKNRKVLAARIGRNVYILPEREWILSDIAKESKDIRKSLGKLRKMV